MVNRLCFCLLLYVWEVLYVTLMLARGITDPKQNPLAYVNLLGKEVSYVATNFGRACLSKMSCDLQNYDMIITYSQCVQYP